MNSLRSMLTREKDPAGRNGKTTKIFAGKEEKGAVTKTGPPTMPASPSQPSKTTDKKNSGGVSGAASRLWSKASGNTSGKVTSMDDRDLDTPPASPGQGFGDSTTRQNLLEGKVNAYCGRRLAPAHLEQAQEDVANEVLRWNGQLDFKKKLQEAKRNHGRVDLMESSKGVKFAVKRMPNRWMQDGPRPFNERYPNTSEKPWVDVAIVSLLQKESFQYVCQLDAIYRDDCDTFVAWEFAPHGDLFAWEDDLKAGKEREAKMLPLTCQLVYAVWYLHEFGIAHRDLSLENVVLSDGPNGTSRIKLIDFGMATAGRSCKDQVCGKQSYRAPEMYTADSYDSFLSDTFAVGVIFYALAVQDYPWISTKRGGCQLFEYVNMYGLKAFTERRKLRKGNGENLIEVLSPDLLEVLISLMAFNPAERGCLGESCWKDRANVRNFRWIKKGFDKEVAALARTDADCVKANFEEISPNTPVPVTSSPEQRNDAGKEQKAKEKEKEQKEHKTKEKKEKEQKPTSEKRPESRERRDSASRNSKTGSSSPDKPPNSAGLVNPKCVVPTSSGKESTRAVETTPALT